MEPAVGEGGTLSVMFQGSADRGLVRKDDTPVSAVLERLCQARRIDASRCIVLDVRGSEVAPETLLTTVEGDALGAPARPCPSLFFSHFLPHLFINNFLNFSRFYVTRFLFAELSPVIVPPVQSAPSASKRGMLMRMRTTSDNIHDHMLRGAEDPDQSLDVLRSIIDGSKVAKVPLRPPFPLRSSIHPQFRPILCSFLYSLSFYLRTYEIFPPFTIPTGSVPAFSDVSFLLFSRSNFLCHFFLTPEISSFIRFMWSGVHFALVVSLFRIDTIFFSSPLSSSSPSPPSSLVPDFSSGKCRTDFRCAA